MIKSLILIFTLFLLCGFTLPSCNTPPEVQKGACMLIQAGIDELEKQLEEGGGDDGEADPIELPLIDQEILAGEIFSKSVQPVLKVTSNKDLMDTVSEYWDQIPDETKYKAGLAVLNYLKGRYCDEEALAGKKPMVRQDKNSAIIDILKGYIPKEV